MSTSCGNIKLFSSGGALDQRPFFRVVPFVERTKTCRPRFLPRSTPPSRPGGSAAGGTSVERSAVSILAGRPTRSDFFDASRLPRSSRASLKVPTLETDRSQISDPPYHGGHFHLRRGRTFAAFLCLVPKRLESVARNPRRRDWIEAESPTPALSSAWPSVSGRKRSTGTPDARPPTNANRSDDALNPGRNPVDIAWKSACSSQVICIPVGGSTLAP